jgi:hypothetical protein
MFFNSELCKLVEVTPVPGEMRVSIPQTGHQCAAFSMENTDAGILKKNIFARNVPYVREYLAFIHNM